MDSNLIFRTHKAKQMFHCIVIVSSCTLTAYVDYENVLISKRYKWKTSKNNLEWNSIGITVFQFLRSMMFQLFVNQQIEHESIYLQLIFHH